MLDFNFRYPSDNGTAPETRLKLLVLSQNTCHKISGISHFQLVFVEYDNEQISVEICFDLLEYLEEVKVDVARQRSIF